MLKFIMCKTSRIFNKTFFFESVSSDDFFQKIHEQPFSSSNSVTKLLINFFTAFFLRCPKMLRSDCIKRFSPCSSPFSSQSRRLNSSINAPCDSFFQRERFSRRPTTFFLSFRVLEWRPFDKRNRYCFLCIVSGKFCAFISCDLFLEIFNHSRPGFFMRVKRVSGCVLVFFILMDQKRQILNSANFFALPAAIFVQNHWRHFIL